MIDMPEIYLEEGWKLLREFVPEGCRSCPEALQAACEVARLAILAEINEATAGLYLGIPIENKCDRSLTGLPEGVCSYITEPDFTPEGGNQPIVEAMVEAVVTLDKEFPNRVPLQK